MVTASPLVTRTTSIQYFNTADARDGKVETITDPRGKVTTMAYDTTTGDLVSVTDPLGHSTTFGYDEAPSPPGRGYRTSVTDALGHVTKTVYEGRGRVKKVINHDLTFTEFGYDAAGRRSTVTDPMGRVTRYVYDRWGRLDTVVDPMNQSTRYSYDLMGNLLTLTDARLQTTTFEYDAHNRVQKTIYPGGAFETFTYDTRGRLATMIDRKNITTTYTYDDLGRLTGKAFTNDPTNTPAFSYTYDVAGRMLTAVNGTDTLTWTYNLAGELLSEASVKNSSTVAYTYDNGGNRLTVSLDGNLFVTYAYDDATRLTTITRGGNVFGFGYDNANRRTSMTYPNGVTTAYVYDELNRLTNLAATHVPTSTPITNFGYQYDAAGNRTQKSTLDYTEDYGYDPLYRLTRADRTNPGATPPNQWTWNYDAVGNRTSAQKDSEATTSTHNEKNQLLQTSGGGKMLWRGVLDEPGTAAFSAASASINGQPARMLAGNVFEATLDLPAGANTVTIQAQDGSGNVASQSYSVNVLGVPATHTYDANGNLATKTEGADAWVYTWNALNQLTMVTKNAVAQATYSYDPLGRRVEKVAGPTTTGWTYDAEDIVRQNATVAAVTTVTLFVHGRGTDEPLGSEKPATSTLSYLHADGLGSIVGQTGANGVLVDSFSYDSWGQSQTGTPSPFGFAAREWDADARLHYNRARYYDPASGRFINEDPARLWGGLNLYRYVDDNPQTFTDPSGLQKSGMSCLDSAASEGAKLGPIYGWGWTHCWVSCETRKRCTRDWGATAGGAASRAGQRAKEHFDFIACVIKGDIARCSSAYQPSDYENNDYGYSCPVNQDCGSRCEPLKGSSSPPGPYWWVACGRSLSCNPWVVTYVPGANQQ
jgi:RHS repeat-associated protein